MMLGPFGCHLYDNLHANKQPRFPISGCLYIAETQAFGARDVHVFVRDVQRVCVKDHSSVA